MGDNANISGGKWYSTVFWNMLSVLNAMALAKKSTETKSGIKKAKYVIMLYIKLLSSIVIFAVCGSIVLIAVCSNALETSQALRETTTQITLSAGSNPNLLAGDGFVQSIRRWRIKTISRNLHVPACTVANGRAMILCMWPITTPNGVYR
jgi:hypothetical protein